MIAVGSIGYLDLKLCLGSRSRYFNREVVGFEVRRKSPGDCDEVLGCAVKTRFQLPRTRVVMDLVSLLFVVFWWFKVD
jgi:hypothetical protein